jgi:hypothetical protein
MPPFITYIFFFLLALCHVDARFLDAGLHATNSSLAPRDDIHDLSWVYNTYAFRKQRLEIRVDQEECPKQPFLVAHDMKLPASPQIEAFTIITCNDKPVWVDNWNFTLTSSCEDKDISLGKVSVVAKRTGKSWQDFNYRFDANVQTCVKPHPDFKADCWGEWIKEPIWDYEWIVQIPNDLKLEKDRCGGRFQDAVNAACPYVMTKWDCQEHWATGATIRFRQDLLCGRTRIEEAIRKASNGEMNVRCPYFVEVPVPP